MVFRHRYVATAGLVLIGLSLGGCPVFEFLNPDLVASAGSGVANLPGDAPELLVILENNTSNVVEMTLAYRNAEDENKVSNLVLAPGQRTAQALVCPVPEITLGSLDDVRAIGAIVRMGAGTENDPYVEVEPFGYILRSGVDYECGDGICFSVVRSGATLSGYQLVGYVQAD